MSKTVRRLGRCLPFWALIIVFNIGISPAADNIRVQIRYSTGSLLECQELLVQRVIAANCLIPSASLTIPVNLGITKNFLTDPRGFPGMTQVLQMLTAPESLPLVLCVLPGAGVSGLQSGSGVGPTVDLGRFFRNQPLPPIRESSRVQRSRADLISAEMAHVLEPLNWPRSSSDPSAVNIVYSTSNPVHQKIAYARLAARALLVQWADAVWAANESSLSPDERHLKDSYTRQNAAKSVEIEIGFATVMEVAIALDLLEELDPNPTPPENRGRIHYYEILYRLKYEPTCMAEFDMLEQKLDSGLGTRLWKQMAPRVLGK